MVIIQRMDGIDFLFFVVNLIIFITTITPSG
jgi:hypothetical protein